MLNLNLISNELKKQNKLNNLYSILKQGFYIVFILVSLYTTVFLIGKLILAWHFTETIAASNFLLKKNEDKTSRIREVNNSIYAVDKIQSEYVQWSKFIIYLSTITDNIKINSIKIDKKTNNIILSGYAANRDDLINLKNKIEQSAYFSDLNFPLKNLLEKTNINFEISAKIKTYEFD